MRRARIRATLSLTLLFSAGALNLSAQSSSETLQNVYRIVYVQKPHEWYAKQANLWKQELERNPQNPQGWYNYYLATEYSFHEESQATKQERLQDIAQRMAAEIPDTFEYYYLANRLEGGKNIDLLEKAHQLQPDNPEPYYGLITNYKLNGQSKKASELLKRLYVSRDIAPGLIEYNYNVLISTAENALLLTNGDNDTFPAWMLQEVKKVRTDVTILNIHLGQNRDYLTRILAQKEIHLEGTNLPENDRSAFVSQLTHAVVARYPETPVCFALTLRQTYLTALQDDLYITGLVYQYSPDTKLDNLALLKKNLERNFRLDYLRFDWYSESYRATQSITVHLNNNYVTPFLMLADHYGTSGEHERAGAWRDFALELARRSGNKGLVDYIESTY